MTEDNNPSIKRYNCYIEIIIMWLLILNKYSTKECVKTLNVYFYLNHLDKKMPCSKNETLNEMNINGRYRYI